MGLGAGKALPLDPRVGHVHGFPLRKFSHLYIVSVCAILHVCESSIKTYLIVYNSLDRKCPE